MALIDRLASAYERQHDRLMALQAEAERVNPADALATVIEEIVSARENGNGHADGDPDVLSVCRPARSCRQQAAARCELHAAPGAASTAHGHRRGPARAGCQGGAVAVASSLTAATAMVGNATLRPDLDARMRPGETRYVLGVATRLDQAALLIDYAREVVRHSPLLRTMLASSSADELVFNLPGHRRSIIKAMPCNARGSRGWSVSMLVADEVAHFVDSENNQSGEVVLQALLPSLAQFGDDGRGVADDQHTVG